MTKRLHSNSLQKVDNPHQWMIDDARMKLIQQIKAEVERLKKNVDDSPLATEQIAGYLLALADIQKKLSTLQEKSEKPTNHLADAGKMMERPRDCSMAVDKDLEEQVELLKQPVCEDLDAYAQSIEDYHDVGEERGYLCASRGDIKSAVILGANWQKEQMLKEAVEGEVCGRVYDHINVRFADGVCKYLEPKNISHIPADVSKYKPGDKVRIIIVKED